MYQFTAFYRGRSINVEAPTSYAAQQKAALIFKAKKSYDVTVIRSDIEHSTASI
jgi:hypothetical protein